MKPYELIEEAALLIERTGWTQHRNARDKYGDGVFIPPQPNQQPTCYCAYGALAMVVFDRVIGYEGTLLVRVMVHDQALTALNDATEDGAIVAFNDTAGRTKPEVLALMWRTATMLRRAEDATTTP